MSGAGGDGGFDSEQDVVARAMGVARVAGRTVVGEDDIGMVLIDSCSAVVRSMGVEPSAWRELTLRYLGDPHPAAATGSALDATATALLHAARQEADRAGHDRVDASHLLVALLCEDGSTVATNGRDLGITAARTREVLGYPPHRRVFADGVAPDSVVRPARGCYVLLGGGRLIESLPRALDVVATIRHRTMHDLRVTVIGATNRWGATATTRRLEQLGIQAVDAHIDCRADAHRSNLGDLDVDAAYVAGGDPARGSDALLGTPAAAGLADLADRGVVMMGMSAGATIWGVATLSSFVSEGEPEPVPMLGFLENTVVVAHHLPDSPRLPDARRAFPQHRIIAIGHEAALRIDGDVVTDLAPGDAPSVVVEPRTSR